MSGSFDVLFESDIAGSWVSVLSDSALVDGKIASQNAGSNNSGLYYQVGGGGMNLRFQTALKASGQLESVNRMLTRGYDARYGQGAWLTDSAGRPPRSDRLTTLLIELAADGVAVGHNVAAMAYSVGPILGPEGIVDDAGYQQIYFDAMQAIDAWNAGTTDPIVALRTTMVSCGIYAQQVLDPTRLFQRAAVNMLAGVGRAVRMYPRLDGFTILVNTNDAASLPRERSAFTAAAQELGISVGADGFTVG